MPKTIVSAAGEALPAAKNATTLCADLDAILDRGVESPIVDLAIRDARAALGALPLPAAKINRRLAVLGGLTAAAALAAKPADAGESPIMTLFREWEATYHSADQTPDEVCNALMAVCNDLEDRMKALPAISAADLAAKLIVETSYGDFLLETDGPFYTEALALCGGRRS